MLSRAVISKQQWDGGELVRATGEKSLMSNNASMGSETAVEALTSIYEEE